MQMKDKEPLYKNSLGVHYLKALFYEMALEQDKDYVLYSLKNYDNNGYPSIQRLFIECDDPTEYTFAKKYFDSWAHWKKVKQCTWFKPIYEEMREELEVKIRAAALSQLRKAGKDDPKNAVQVNKYLLDKGWVEKDDKRGRPSKEKIVEEANKIFKDQESYVEDFDRIVGNVERH